MTTLSTAVVITDQAVATLKAQGRASQRRERGGILVGYRTDNRLHVHEALVVPDHAAAQTRYVRRRHAGQRVLDEWLHATGDRAIGYVGEWHTHPAPLPPSPTDLKAARLMCLTNRQPVALLVAALAVDAKDVTLHALLTRPHTLPRRIIGSFAHVTLEAAD